MHNFPLKNLKEIRPKPSLKAVATHSVEAWWKLRSDISKQTKNKLHHIPSTI